MPCGFIIKNALDETAGMRYSVCVSGKSLLAYYSPAGNDRVLQPIESHAFLGSDYSPAGNDRVLQPYNIGIKLRI